MKYLCCILLSLASTAFGTGIGDTYQQVISEKGNPRSQVAAGSRRVLQYPDVSIVLQNDVVSNINAVVTPPPVHLSAPVMLPASTSHLGKIDVLKIQLANAVAQVKAIVNQPVNAQPRLGDMKVSVFSPGWFHDGAIRPDFNRVDVRKTQEFPYDSHPFVSSDLTPDVAFVGRELEFNSMTKFFYVDRSLPKKKLTQDEMLEINRLYRIIGQCEQQLNQQ